ncbi:unnamed protein product [Calicophoron daubneyi]
MKASVYGQFVAGENRDEIQAVVKKMRKYGVKSILDYSAEKDIKESEAVDKVKQTLVEAVREPKIRPAEATKKYQISIDFADRSKKVIAARTYFYESEYQCEKNMEIFLDCIDAVSRSTDNEGFAAIKLTALGRPQLLLQMSDFLTQMQRLFALMTASDGHNSGLPVQKSALDIDNFRTKLERLGVKISYDEHLKWFTLLDVHGDGVVDLLDWTHLRAFEHDLASIFTVKNKETGKMEQLVPTLTPDGLEQMRNMLRRADIIAEHTKSVGARVMIDAEQSYFQPAIRRMTIEMMRSFNRDRAVVFNTYQTYLKDTLKELREDMNHASVENFCFGAKLVRGAYLEQERARAKALDYEDPVCPDYDATTKMFESCIDESLHWIQKRSVGRVAVMVASHNEDTIRYAIKRMHECGVTAGHRLICFGQLYGMCDQLSFTLGQNGYSVYKYVPYGPVDEVIPYLTRRAIENSSIFSSTKKERRLMWKELGRRLAHGRLIYTP